jgi:hypothetical protein
MPSSYTPLLRLVLPVTGELTGTWGDTVNNGITSLVEAAIAGTANVAMTDANKTLSTANEAADEARQAVINLTGALTASRNVVCPASSKLYIVRNATTGGQNIVFKTASGTGITVANGTTRFLRCDGTNVVEAFSEFGGNAGTVTNGVYTTGDQTIGGNKTFSGNTVVGGNLAVTGNASVDGSLDIEGAAYTPPLQPTHSATPTFDCATSNVFEPAALTSNVTSMTMSNPVGGQTVNIRFMQDATGGRTVAVPTGAKVLGSVNLTANGVSWLIMTYSARASRWEGAWSQVPA